MAGKESFQEVFDALKPVFEQYAGRLAIQVDKPGQYYLETKTAIHKGRPLQFGGVKIGKAYVSFHLMPIYMNPKLQATISPELKKRMQGKSCFNFTRVDPSHIAELKKLTKAGFEVFKTWGQKLGRGFKERGGIDVIHETDDLTAAELEQVGNPWSLAIAWKNPFTASGPLRIPAKEISSARF